MHLRMARWLITVTNLMFGLIPVVVDVSATHVLHPDWTPHARFHTVWLISTNSMIALLSTWLLWSGTFAVQRARLAGALSLVVLAGFWVAALTRDLYGGAFGDEGGFPTIAGLDANAVVFSFETTNLLVAFALMRSEQSPTEGDGTGARTALEV